MPGLTNPAMLVGANAMRAFMTHAQLHWASAGLLGTSNLTPSGRLFIPWTVPVGDGDFGLASTLVFTGGVPFSPIYSLTIWSSISGGAFCGEFILGGDPTFNSLGSYRVTVINLNGSATWAGAAGADDTTAGANVAILLPNTSDRLYPVLRPIRTAVGR
jgi:hypothetical protein